MIADEAAARRAEGQAGLAAARRRMSVISALRSAILSMTVPNIRRRRRSRRLVGLLAARWTVAEQDARAADRQLEAFATQGLDQHSELESPRPATS